MNKINKIEIKYLNDFKKDKINHIHRLDERINELNRMKNMLLQDIKNIEADIKEIENK